jgi:hypothetical protein
MPDAAVYLFVDFVARPQLSFVEPAANSTTLQGIVEPQGKGFVCVIITDET